MAPAETNSTNPTNPTNHGADVPSASVAVCIAVAVMVGIAACLLQRRRHHYLSALHETGPRPAQASHLDTKALGSIPIITYREMPPRQEEWRPPHDHHRGRWTWSPYRHLSHNKTTSPQDGERGTAKGNAAGVVKSCAICTEDFVDGSRVRRLPCGHCFHPACVESWLLGFSTTCPLWYDTTISGSFSHIILSGAGLCFFN